MSDKAPTPVNPLEQALANILQKTVDVVEAGVNFLSEQLPDVIQQLLVWHAVKSGLLFIVYTALLIGAVIFAKNNYVKAMAIEKSGGDGFGRFVVFGFFTVLSVILFFVVKGSLDWLQILVAPKLYLIEYAAELYKGDKP